MKKTNQVKRRGGSCNVKANYPMRLTRSVVRKIKAFEREAMITSPENSDTWVSTDSETHCQEDSDDSTKGNHDNYESNTTESDNTSPAVAISQGRTGQIIHTEVCVCVCVGGWVWVGVGVGDGSVRVHSKASTVMWY